VSANRWVNIVILLSGALVVFASLRLVLHHQYTVLHRDWRMEPKQQISTFVLLLSGIWIFLVGLYGLVGKKGRENTGPE